MSKLIKLKKWLTIDDAADYLTNSFNELVTESDLLQLTLEGQISISAYFPIGVTASNISKDINTIESFAFDDSDSKNAASNGYLEVPSFLRQRTSFRAKTIYGVYDIPMLGGSRNFLFQFYLKYLKQNKNEIYSKIDHYQIELLSDANNEIYLVSSTHHPVGIPVDNCIFVYKVDALLEFEQSINAQNYDCLIVPNAAEISNFRPVSRSSAQDDFIIHCIESCGKTPKKLPRVINGLAGVKAEIREICIGERPDLLTNKSFDKSWLRLLNEGRICYCDEQLV